MSSQNSDEIINNDKSIKNKKVKLLKKTLETNYNENNEEINNDNNKESKNKKVKLASKNANDNDDNKNGFVTPIKSTIVNNEEFGINVGIENKIKSETNNNDDMVDVFNLFDSLIRNDNKANNVQPFSNNGNQTVVDIIKIFSSSIEGLTLIAFVLSNFYGGRHYINNNINKATKLMYSKSVELICSDKVNIPNKSDVSYLVHKNNRPIVIVSSIPRCENIFHFETMKETLQTLVDTFQGKPDPENKGKVFKFNFLNDFIMDTHQKKKSFAFICKNITLPDRLTYSNQASMEHNSDKECN